MDTNVIIFIAMCIVGVLAVIVQSCKQECSWLAYWALYIAYMSQLGSKIF